ncbi:deleted in malignant brain tumors 1 protein [Anguilla anguilla]|uniref:deleted in malignant brain tumors 1 protein n=1 Tax=Anguilla anguilla TaxID=7936 RepID=UPI0015AC97D1|nr:deleted in malignant brain tumors 1 protein [Anguilla anguilla]XP_035237561.1 deleted in malignant brain tumors 1 protein [Anguilla anguilla]XP_035237562.1 deleted in malignant brain tumors 1 protein [Anguilla anguilla]XP_035237563.1 deleted in malignant brain tumors 1 protein [Anguilla anguilla]
MLTDVLILTLGITLAFGNTVNMSGSLPVRLVDGGMCSGRVEVYRDHQWGAVCWHGWGLREAGVVCRELGCGSATGASHGAAPGGRRGVVWHADVQCSGQEEELAQCRVLGVWRAAEDGGCAYRHTAAARCSEELHTPEIWYNVSVAAPPSRVVRGHGFNVTCSVPHRYAGSSVQLRLVRSNGTVRQEVPARGPSVTFAFASAQASHEGYYYCLYRVRLGGQVFASRESQPLPLILAEPEPLLSAMELSWLVSAVIFVVAVLAIVAVACSLRKRRRHRSELERRSRTCVENTYTALPVK